MGDCITVRDRHLFRKLFVFGLYYRGDGIYEPNSYRTDPNFLKWIKASNRLDNSASGMMWRVKRFGRWVIRKGVK